jgi:hypothetical protein
MKQSNFKEISLSIIVTLLVFVAYFFIVSQVFPEKSDRGFFGDMFGGINALFSGLAFLGVIYAVVLQRDELRLQREELKLSREELKKSVEVQQKSEEALRNQIKSMEKTAKLNGLSSILQYHSSSIVAATTGIRGVDTTGRDQHRRAAEEIKQKIEDTIKDE